MDILPPPVMQLQIHYNITICTVAYNFKKSKIFSQLIAKISNNQFVQKGLMQYYIYCFEHSYISTLKVPDKYRSNILQR